MTLPGDQAVARFPVTMTAPQRGALASLSLAQFTTTLEFTIVFIALPSLGRDLGFAPAVLAWVAGTYAVAFGGFLVLGGRLADRFGARRLFFVAVTAFALGSGIGAVAATGPVLLGARGLQGLAAALLQPAILGLMQAVFPDEPVRGRAWGVWAGVGAAGLGIGALLGGLLTALSWRWTFAINVPLLAVCAVSALAWIRTDPAPARPVRIPVVSAALGTGTALSAALALTLGGELGWTSPAPWAALAVAVVLALGFARHERDATRALIDPALRKVASLWLGAGVTALYMASVGSAYYLLTLLLQDQWGYTALRAGLAFLPLAVLVTLGSACAPTLIRRLGPVPVLAVGFGCAAAGLGWIAVTLNSQSYPILLAGLLVSGLGNGMVFTAMFDLGTRDVPAAQHGTAGGILVTAQYLASTLALTLAALLLGPIPTPTTFQHAFLACTAAAAAGAGLLLTPHRRRARS